MINIRLSNLNVENLNRKVLQATEDICETYRLNKEFGYISMANQMVVDYLLKRYEDLQIEVNLNLENDELMYIYSSSKSVFCDLFNTKQVMKEEYHIISLLSDEYEFSAEGETLSLTFHVKPYIMTPHVISSEITKQKSITI